MNEFSYLIPSLCKWSIKTFLSYRVEFPSWNNILALLVNLFSSVFWSHSANRGITSFKRRVVASSTSFLLFTLLGSRISKGENASEERGMSLDWTSSGLQTINKVLHDEWTQSFTITLIGNLPQYEHFHMYVDLEYTSFHHLNIIMENKYKKCKTEFENCDCGLGNNFLTLIIYTNNNFELHQLVSQAETIVHNPLHNTSHLFPNVLRYPLQYTILFLP